MKNTAVLLASASPLALAQSLCAQYQTTSSSGYTLNNNEWGMDAGTGSQCLNVNSISGSGVSFSVPWSWSGGDNNVKSYPNAGLDVTPEIVSNINTIPTNADWSLTGDGLNCDVSYDLFTAADPSHDTYSGDYELMIW